MICNRRFSPRFTLSRAVDVEPRLIVYIQSRYKWIHSEWIVLAITISVLFYTARSSFLSKQAPAWLLFPIILRGCGVLQLQAESTVLILLVLYTVLHKPHAFN
ncbi:hypothetical protein H112_06175 [Trichophyton rubrum D6]|uniref:Uncharacterized protein n=3 Tax=Trichophyton TaxID=5550 RepID=F2SGK7_TRIRC|nr:uncharacterized protein TERG_01547 [Trichophyton rubrum CBS 118892]EZF13804.1 hypothetical protein H100_06189 [Trichophyton rubrum MR850]EZF39538.1 hypothetical protein H102_06157 [Trichophyton rubrum CBS 100081]EZF50362.1 hypothetical protein H103_06182 [Trichophyton rubrum CBS 288.86]EZF60694.1 hypothetical protein H104_06169 [Trichophyton rubrum CBS 289.86]EZF71529.1 hypothetical protein H105_06194 [Trichophyton soudanense CBS 452.61]EZF82021.1 hypothetical protein H110_06178 [Trichophy